MQLLLSKTVSTRIVSKILKISRTKEKMNCIDHVHCNKVIIWEIIITTKYILKYFKIIILIGIIYVIILSLTIFSYNNVKNCCHSLCVVYSRGHNSQVKHLCTFLKYIYLFFVFVIMWKSLKCKARERHMFILGAGWYCLSSERRKQQILTSSEPFLTQSSNFILPSTSSKATTLMN